jgi:HEAT repeat protein
MPTLDQLLQQKRSANNARSSAVFALAGIGKGQEKRRREQIVERLIDLLRDPWYYVHSAAAYSLKQVGDPAAIPALQAYAHRLSHQDRVEVEEIIDSLRAMDKTDGSTFKKQVEELRDTVRKLEDRVEKLTAKVEQEAASEIEEKT